MVLNSRPDKEEFYKIILYPTDGILARGVEGAKAMEVDKEDLEEVEVTASFAEKTGVFDKAPAVESTPRTETASSQASKPFIP